MPNGAQGLGIFILILNSNACGNGDSACSLLLSPQLNAQTISHHSNMFFSPGGLDNKIHVFIPVKKI